MGLKPQANGEKPNPAIDAVELEFLTMINQTDLMQGDLYESLVAELDTVQFHAFDFESKLPENSLQFLTFKIFKHYNFFK